jgi:RHS repeat-associated protein
LTTIPIRSSPTSSSTATYDAWNRLVSLTNGSTTGATTVATYAYDGLSRRVVKGIYVSGTLDHNEHAYFNEKWQPLEVRKEVSGTVSSNPLEQYVWHSFYIDAPVLRDYDPTTSGSPTRYYYSFDANFNVTAATNSTGTPVERYSYSSYGAVTFLTAAFSPLSGNLSAIGNPILFTGRTFDADSGLYYYRNRLYDAQLGQFLTRDPIESESNLYNYVSNEPNCAADPMGLACQRVQRRYNIPLVNWQSPGIPIYGFIKLYGSIGLRAEVDLNETVCDVCCSSGKSGKEYTVQGRARFGLSGAITIGWQGEVKVLGVTLSGWAGARGEAWAYGSGSGSAQWTTCRGDEPTWRICGSLDARFRLSGGGQLRYQYGYYSYDIAAQVYGQITYSGVGGCAIFKGFNWVGAEGHLGTWSDPSIWLEFCFGGCWRYQLY